eukprot:COSAG01_NODE_1744_length_9355_cov_6.094327_2_plen_185_part_00
MSYVRRILQLESCTRRKFPTAVPGRSLYTPCTEPGALNETPCRISNQRIRLLPGGWLAHQTLEAAPKPLLHSSCRAQPAPPRLPAASPPKVGGTPTAAPARQQLPCSHSRCCQWTSGWQHGSPRLSPLSHTFSAMSGRERAVLCQALLPLAYGLPEPLCCYCGALALLQHREDGGPCHQSGGRR